LIIISHLIQAADSVARNSNDGWIDQLKPGLRSENMPQSFTPYDREDDSLRTTEKSSMQEKIYGHDPFNTFNFIVSWGATHMAL
jgi:hypothetical protein